MKQAIILNTSLKMGKGKAAAQSAHASLEAFLSASSANRDDWLHQGMAKIVLKVPSDKELLELFEKAKRRKLACALIHDAGRTQIPAGSITALAIGPDEDEKIDEITSQLKLL